MELGNRIPRVRIREDNFSEEIKNPSYPEECMGSGRLIDYMIEVSNSKDEVIALFFVVDGYDRGGQNLFESQDLDSFVADFDWWLEPNLKWEDVGLQRWLPERLKEWELKELLNDSEVSDLNKFEYDYIDDNWRDYIRGPSCDTGPERSDLPALLLMAYGRLKYPYKLTEEIRENCELYLRVFIKNEDLFRKGDAEEHLSKYYPGEIYDLFTLCADLYSNKKSFRDALLNREWPNSYRRCINWSLETFIVIADSILGNENINRFLDEAHAENKPELKFFLLDYKNKHFPVDGQQLELSSE